MAVVQWLTKVDLYGQNDKTYLYLWSNFQAHIKVNDTFHRSYIKMCFPGMAFPHSLH